MVPGKLEPPVSFTREHTRDFQNYSSEFRHLVVLMPGERLQAGNILCRDHRLVKEPMQLFEAFQAIPLFVRHPLARLADVNAMAAPTELFVWTRPAANSAIMSHAQEVAAYWLTA
jgi:hypothetical protein